jgi:hypothetical protein
MNNLEKLKDIKSIVEVVDYSLYYFIIIVFILILGIIFISYKYMTRVKKTKQLSKKQLALKGLKNLDFNDTKKVVYSLSVDGYMFINKKNKDKFENIEKKLEEFKYKKDVEKLPNKLEKEIKQFIKELK